MRASMLGGLSFASKSWKRALSRKMAQATIGPLTADFAVCAALALVSLSLSSGNRARVARLIVSAQHCGEDPAARRRRDTIEHQQWNPVAVLRAHRHKRAAQIARALVRPFLDIRVDQHRETFFPRSFERSSAVFPPAEAHNVAKDETDRNGGEKVARRQCFQAIAPVTDCVAIPEAGLTFDTRLLARFCARHGCGRDCRSDGTPGYSGDCEKTLCHRGRIKAGVLFLRRVDQITDDTGSEETGAARTACGRNDDRSWTFGRILFATVRTHPQINSAIERHFRAVRLPAEDLGSINATHGMIVAEQERQYRDCNGSTRSDRCAVMSADARPRLFELSLGSIPMRRRKRLTNPVFDSRLRTGCSALSALRLSIYQMKIPSVARVTS